MLRWKTFGALALACSLAGPVLVGPAPAVAAAKPAATPAAKSRPAGMRQFTGWVTALDKESITVEKRGNAPRTLVFSRDAELRTVGTVEKDARVTVYYQDDDGQLTAHRVVAKTAKSTSTTATTKKRAEGGSSGGR